MAALPRPWLMASFSLATTGCGVLAGAITANQDCTEKPGRPDSASVGTSGAKGARSSEVTPRARSLPAFTWGSDEGRLSNMESTCPPSRSATAGPLPRYGTCRMSVPVSILKISHDRWMDEPLPDDAQVSLPGCCLA